MLAEGLPVLRELPRHNLEPAIIGVAQSDHNISLGFNRCRRVQCNDLEPRAAGLAVQRSDDLAAAYLRAAVVRHEMPAGRQVTRLKMVPARKPTALYIGTRKILLVAKVRNQRDDMWV